MTSLLQEAVAQTTACSILLEVGGDLSSEILLNPPTVKGIILPLLSKDEAAAGLTRVIFPPGPMLKTESAVGFFPSRVVMSM